MGYFHTKHLAVSWGYAIQTDAPFSLCLMFWRRRRIKQGEHIYRLNFSIWWDWPKLIWAHEAWAVNEPGYLRGMPVRRPQPLRRLWPGQKWHLRGVGWYRGWSFKHYG